MLGFREKEASADLHIEDSAFDHECNLSSHSPFLLKQRGYVILFVLGNDTPKSTNVVPEDGSLHLQPQGLFEPICIKMDHKDIHLMNKDWKLTKINLLLPFPISSPPYLILGKLSLFTQQPRKSIGCCHNKSQAMWIIFFLHQKLCQN